MEICSEIGTILLITIVAIIVLSIINEWHKRYAMRQAVKQAKAMYAIRTAKDRLKK